MITTVISDARRRLCSFLGPYMNRCSARAPQRPYRPRLVGGTASRAAPPGRRRADAQSSVATAIITFFYHYRLPRRFGSSIAQAAPAQTQPSVRQGSDWRPTAPSSAGGGGASRASILLCCYTLWLLYCYACAGRATILLYDNYTIIIAIVTPGRRPGAWARARGGSPRGRLGLCRRSDRACRHDERMAPALG